MAVPCEPNAPRLREVGAFSVLIVKRRSIKHGLRLRVGLREEIVAGEGIWLRAVSQMRPTATASNEPDGADCGDNKSRGI
jgi:hypothetical protein